MEINLRKATESDIHAIMKLVHELAEFEREPDEVINTEEQMKVEGFGANPSFYAILAEVDGIVRGMLVYFYSYSTWKGKSIYIDDIIVNEEFRGLGIGRKLMEATIMVAKEEGVGKLHWQVLEWNEQAIKFYNKYSPEYDAEWINCSLNKEQMLEFEF